MKLALCINTHTAPIEVRAAYVAADKPHLVQIDPTFFYTPTFMANRAVCETDETMLQLLPYVAVVAEDGRIFTYTRGGSGEEARLHGNFSVGLGGHVDRAPATTGHLLTLLKEECCREGLEEANLLMQVERIQFTHFICDGTNSVGRVHLGLLCVYRITQAEADALDMGAESGIIDSGRWEQIADLSAPDTFARLENWSAAVVDYLGSTH